MAEDSCCICAHILSDSIDPQDFKSEKQPLQHPPRRLPCCNRSICSPCLAKNPRFESYCPYCQVSTIPTPLPQGLRDPPAYSEKPTAATTSTDNRHPSNPRATTTSSDDDDDHTADDDPPGYYTLAPNGTATATLTPDVTHHLRPTDTLAALSLAYAVPAPVLRAHNRLHADHLLAARRTLRIPGSHYAGPSLSARPVEDPAEAERKARLRRFMVAAKCHEYEVAELYLRQAGGELGAALERWEEDERWERENPLQKGKGKGQGGGPGRRRGAGGGLTGQI
ncbi:hypothetical protein FH972_026552 [Carpinus fangiana]|uniref:LysM domain-containing protein n=1 Tax=Carpinus fangiana TaxID=176857 RepID=A0A5N6L4B4_9ROSI|nr:hypothetical protein FH972_026552 [Carpinus fangiana]